MEQRQPVSIPPELAALAASALLNLARGAWEAQLVFALLEARLRLPDLVGPLTALAARPAFWLAVLFGAGLLYWPALALTHGRAMWHKASDLSRGSIAKGELHA